MYFVQLRIAPQNPKTPYNLFNYLMRVELKFVDSLIHCEQNS